MIDSPDSVHIPILTREILDLLQLRPGDDCIDATVDGGGHASAFLEATAPDGRLLGIDRDPELLAVAQQRLAAPVATGRATLVGGNFRDLDTIAASHGFAGVRAILFDFGISSYHFDRSGRGFAFAHDEPLDMRFDATEEAAAGVPAPSRRRRSGAPIAGETAADILASRSLDELTRLFGELGEERFSRRIAGAVVRERERQPIATTQRLLEVIAGALPRNIRWQANRSAARIFQALRIAVNDELEAVRQAVPLAFELLGEGGMLATLSFHSLEDRIVKQFLVAQAHAGRCQILTKKPVRAGDEEIAHNPRAASAKLRVARRIADR